MKRSRVVDLTDDSTDVVVASWACAYCTFAHGDLELRGAMAKRRHRFHLPAQLAVPARRAFLGQNDFTFLHFQIQLRPTTVSKVDFLFHQFLHDQSIFSVKWVRVRR